MKEQYSRRVEIIKGQYDVKMFNYSLDNLIYYHFNIYKYFF